MIASAVELEQLQADYSASLKREKVRILVCAGTGCIASGSLRVYEEFKRLVAATGNLVDIDLLHEDAKREGEAVVQTGCRGFCAAGPLPWN